jgi:hypothetical protein
MFPVKLDRLPSPTSPWPEGTSAASLSYAARLAEALNHEACRCDPELRRWVAACLLSAAPFPAHLVIRGGGQ